MRTTITEPSFSLQPLDLDDPAPALTGVQVNAHLDGVMLALTLRQTYVNRADRPIEVQYTFPVPHGAVLLDMAAEFDGRRLHAEVLPRRAAQTRYEDALDAGDAPVLLEESAPGLFTANLGNVLPGESVVLEITQARLLSLEQGRLRVAIPTTVAPRYGLPQDGGLQPHQVPEVSLGVSYPLSLALTVTPALGRCTVGCPTHAHTLAQTAQGTVLTLSPGAVLDRDVVIEVQPAEPQPHWLAVAVDPATEDAPQMALAAFTLPVLAPSDAVALRVLLDCSGSMAGSSITSTRRAVRALLRALGPRDEVSLTCFGSHWAHLLEPGRCSPAHLDRAREALRQVDADMGGTEMAAALQAVFAGWPTERSSTGSAAAAGADVLLITDGQVWNTPQLLAQAAASGHRVFAIGVGTAPVEDVLRELAEATGGACEFVTPGEAVREAAQRMLARIRQPSLGTLAVDWGGASPRWTLPLARSARGGDTVLALAGFDGGLEALMAAGPSPLGVVRLMARDGGALRELARTEAMAPADARLARVAAARRLPFLEDTQAEALAVAQRLVSRHTHAVLVHERAAGERPAEAAALHRVPNMLAAGWGGTGQVVTDLSVQRFCTDSMHAGDHLSLQTPSVWRSHRGSALDAVGEAAAGYTSHGEAFADFAEPGIPAFLRRQQDPEADRLATLRSAVGRVRTRLAEGADGAALALEAGRWPQADAVSELLVGLRDLGATPGLDWLLLVLWAAEQQEDEATAQQLRMALGQLSKHGAGQGLEAEGVPLNAALAWLDDQLDTSPLAQRLRQALVRAPAPAGA